MRRDKGAEELWQCWVRSVALLMFGTKEIEAEKEVSGSMGKQWAGLDSQENKGKDLSYEFEGMSPLGKRGDRVWGSLFI